MSWTVASGVDTHKELHVAVALQCVRHHPETTAYYERLLAAGKTTREARRCVKRALAPLLPTPMQVSTVLLTT